MPHTTLVTTDQLAAHLSSVDDNTAGRSADRWVIVDCRYDLGNESWGHEQYLKAHIPGAAYASLSHDLAAARTGQNGRHPLPAVGAMAETFSRFGIGAGVQVVVYDQDVGMLASRMWWMLRYLGHDAVAVLDGGWARWTQEGRPVRAGEERHAPAEFVPHVREGWRLTLDAMQRLAPGDALLVDARSAERFEGRVEPIDRVGGHIPGARNHHYMKNVDEHGVMRAPESLRATFEALLGGRAAEEVVLYCGSGVSACHNLLAMAHAGLTGARLYPGSWSEWSADPARPVATGPAPEHDVTRRS